MSLSELARATRRTILLMGLLALGGCGFHPLYGGKTGSAALDDLAAVQVGTPGGRLGQITRNQLIDDLNPDGRQREPLYQLLVTMTRTNAALAIQTDATATRYDLSLAASFVLTEKKTNTKLYSGAIRRTSSYNVGSDPFSVLIAEQDAERRASSEISKGIASQLGIYFEGIKR